MTTRNSVDPQLHELAGWLLVYESTVRDSSQESLSALESVFEKFRHLLITLIGAVGYRALIGRVVKLAKTETPQLNTLQVKPDGSLEGIGERFGQDQTEGADVLLIAQLIALLATFVGTDLMLILVLDKWPDLPVSHSTLWKKGHESTK